MLNDIVVIAVPVTKEQKGIRFVQKVHKQGFNEFVDIAHVTLEAYNLGNTNFDTKTVKNEVISVELDVKDIPNIIKALRSFSPNLNNKKRIVGVQLVTDMKQYNKTNDKTEAENEL